MTHRPARSLPLLLAVVAGLLPAQQQSDEQLQRLRAEKLKKAAFTKVPWLTDFDAAKAKAAQEHKVLLGYFTRSYRPCVPCDQVENGMLTEDRFAVFARGVVPFLHITSMTRGEPQPKLHTELGLQEYPAMLFLDTDGSVLCRVPELTVDNLAATLPKVNELRELRPKAAAGGALAQQRLFLIEADLGRLSIAALEAGLQAHADLPVADRERVAVMLTDLQLDDLQTRARQLGNAEVLRQVAAIAKSGRRPSEPRAPQFWAQALAHAADSKDAQLAATAFGELERRFGKDQRQERQMQAWTKLRERAAAR
jgi:hypothetical protein